MKLRSFFMAVMAGAALLVGCNKEVDFGPAKVALDQTNLAFEVAGGSQAVSLTATRDWAVNGVPEWVAVSATNGQAAVEAQPLKITVTQNAAYDRSATLVFTIGFARTSLIINQAGPNGQVDNGDGTLENPYNVTGVIEYLNELGADVNSPKKVFVKGKVSALASKESDQFGGTGNTFGNGSFTMSDDGSVNGGQFTAYRINYLGNKKFAAGDTPVVVGDEVIVYGNVVNYKGNTPETQQNQAFLYSLNGENRGGVDAGSGEDGEEVPDENLEPAGDNNIAGLVAKIDKSATQTAPTAIADFALTSATVTYVNGSSAYIEDKSGAVLLYKSGHGLKAGDVLSGTLSTSGYYRYGVPQLTSLDGITPTAGEAPAPTEMTIEYLLSTYSSQLSRFLIIKDITVSTGMSGRNAVISQGDKSVNVYAGLSSGLNLAQDATGDIIVFPTLYNTTKQVSFWDNSHFIGNGSEPGGDEPGGDEPGEDIKGYTIQLTNENTWTEGTDATYGPGYETTVEGIKIGVYKHSSTNDIIAPDQYSARVYKGAVISITAPEGVNMTGIQFQANDYNGGQYCKDLSVLEGGSGILKANATTYKVGPWTGSANKVVFQSPDAQSRLVSITLAFDGDFNPGGDEPGGDQPGGDEPNPDADAYVLDKDAISSAHTDAWNYQSGEKKVTATDGSVWTLFNTYASKDQPTVQMNKGKDAYILTPAAPEGKTAKRIAVVLNQSNKGDGEIGDRPLDILSADGSTTLLDNVTGQALASGLALPEGHGQVRIICDETNGGAVYITSITVSFVEGGDEPGGEEPGGDEPKLPVNDGLTEATAFTVEDAIYVAKNGMEDKEYFVKAVVGKDISIKNGTASFELVDGTTDGKLTVVKAKSFGGEDFANDAPIEWLDEVILKGKVTEYSTLPALVNGQLVKWNGLPVFEAQFKTIAELNALCTATATEYVGMLENAVVSFVPSTSNAIIKDATGSILLYKKDHGLKQGQTYSGLVTVTALMYNGNYTELTAIDAAFTGDEAAVEPQTVTLATLAEDGYDKWQNAYVTIKNMEVTAVDKKNVSVKGSNWIMFSNAGNATCAVGDMITVTGTVTKFGETLEIKAWTMDAIVKAEPAFSTVAELNAACTATAQELVGKLTDAVVSFVPDNKNAVIKDATGSILLYKTNHGLKQGQTFSGWTTVKAVLYNNAGELTAMDAAFTGDEADVAPEALSLATLAADFAKYQNAYVVVENLEVTAVSGKNISVKDGETSYVVFSSAGNATCKVGAVIKATGTVAQYNGNGQIKAWALKDIEVTKEAPGEEPGDEPEGGIYASTVTWTLGEKAYSEKATVNGVENVPVLKLGTSSVIGSATLTIPSGATKITFYAVSWSGKPSKLVFKNGDTELGSVTPAANDGLTSTSPYTLTVTDSDKYEITVSGVTSITVQTDGSNKRAALFAIVSE